MNEQQPPLTPRTQPSTPVVSQPILAVSAALIRNDQVLFVRRRHAPSAGMLALPGGKVEAGETLEEAVVRELLEETSIHAKPLRLLTTVDAIRRDPTGALSSHHVIISFLCEWLSGSEKAGSDASELLWLDLDAMQQVRQQIVPSALEAAKLALQKSARKHRLRS